MQNKIFITITIILWSVIGTAQENLSKQEAVSIALDHNYDIKVTNNNVEAAKNSSSIYNSGYLPTLSATGGGNYQDKDSENEFQDGRIIDQTTSK